MQTVNQERRALAVRAQQYQEALRRQLNRQLNVGGKNNGPWMGGVDWTPDGRNNANDPRSTQLRMGEAVTEAQLKEVMRKSGGNPYLKQLQELEKRAKQNSISTLPQSRSVSRQANANINNLLMLAAAQEADNKLAEANAANQARYDQGLGELGDLRSRNSERVQNFGKAAKADLEERFSQNLANVTANLSSRGLGNSTILPAFEAKNARDLAREQQRLSEMVDDRASRYDTSDTNNLVGFVERRDDIGPDLSAINELALRMGQSGMMGGGDFMGGEAQQPAAPTEQTLESIGYQRPRMGLNVPYAMSSHTAPRIQAAVGQPYGSLQQLMNPVGVLQGVMNGVASLAGATGRPLVSNSYPIKRTPLQYAAIQSGSQAKAQQNRADNMRTNFGRAMDYKDSGGYQGFRQRQRFRNSLKQTAANPLPAPTSQTTAPLSQWEMSLATGGGRDSYYFDELRQATTGNESFMKARDIMSRYNLYP